MAQQFAIRSITLEDAEKLLAYFRSLVELDPERVERLCDAQALTVHSEKLWIAGILAKTSGKNFLATCVEIDGKIVAFGEVERCPRWIERHVGEIRFGVIPGYEDYALAIVEYLMRMARVINIEMLQYFHLATQLTGLEIMRREGFREIGRAERYYKRGKEYIDRVYMQKVLSK